ncbi:MAG: TonB-dependent receptor, partial [Saprospiraceae bacterium]|nr:TonB-dependent receptor [Saprospiraceae bacterium]
MKKTLFSILFILFSIFSAISQRALLRGIISDANTKEPLIGASVVIKGTTKGVISDVDGSYQLELEKGSNDIIVSYVGYATVETTVEMAGDMTLDVPMTSSIALKEVVVTADIAIDRKTPVAFSNLGTVKIKEELASQDLPMLLNSMPGAYATQQGGGDGDARISIRGFNQRNIAVMLDGIPVNDMENGQVYWSNWFGLNQVTKTMQVQRGLGASKITIPAVGGTINILTKGFESKPSLEIKQDAGAGSAFQTSLGFTTGRLKGDWGITGAFSSRKSDGWVDGNYSQALFYFLRIDKELGKHLITLSGFGGPQEHGQRAFSAPIAATDSKLARELGVPDAAIDRLKPRIDRGLKYSDAWGYLDGQVKSVRYNYYHKPQFSLRHSWRISDKTFLSNVSYLSIGNGGGTNITSQPSFDSLNQLDLNRVIQGNQGTFATTSNVIRASVNNHFWYGLLSTLRHEFSKKTTFSGGIDLRSYKGEHYRTIKDMMRGKQYIGARNARIDELNTPLSTGDKFFYNYDGFVRWGGGFGLLEYSEKNWTWFLNGSAAMSQYKYHDKMYAETFTLDGKTYYTSNVSTRPPNNLESNILLRVPVINKVMYTVDHPTQAIYNYAKLKGYSIDSTTAQDQVLGWINLPSFTLKTGFNYRFNRQNSIFTNIGWLSKATRFNNVFYSAYNSATATKGELGKIFLARNYKNEDIKAIEMGYQYRSPKFAANVNTYYTLWKNKPVESQILVLEDPSDQNSDRIPIAVNGLGARHVGLEIDFAYEISKKWKVEGLTSLGDWIWNSVGILTQPNGDVQEFDATGVHVGDAAQTQIGGSVRFEPRRGTYIMARATYFGKNYSNMDPESLQGANARKDSWKMPNYAVADLHLGHSIRQKKGPTVDFRFSLLNIFNTTYIADARNNDTLGNVVGTRDFDAKSATVFFGL